MNRIQYKSGRRSLWFILYGSLYNALCSARKNRRVRVARLIFSTAAAANLLPSSATGGGRSRHKLFALRAHNPSVVDTKSFFHNKKNPHSRMGMRIFWLREEDSNFRPHLCGARNALFSLSLGAFRPRQRACCSLYPALRALAPAHRLFAQGLITLGRRRKLIHNKKIKGTPKGVPLISGKLHRFRYRHSFLKDIVVIFLQKLFFRNFLSLT